VEEALRGDDFWKKRTTMQESEGGPKWDTEKMSKGSICLYFSLQQGKLMQSPTKLQTHF